MFFGFFESFHPTCAAMSARRLVVDPAIGIADLQKCYQTLADKIGSRDILEYLRHPRNLNFNWKTAPHPEWMAKSSTLMSLFLQVVPNGLLPSAKNKTALKRLNEHKKANFSRYSDEDWADQIDQRARVLLAQYRSCKQKQDVYLCCMRKATEEEKKAIDGVLDCLQVDLERQSSDQSIAENKNDPDALALVPYKQAKPISSSTPAIFGRILQKQESSPERASKEKALAEHFAQVPGEPSQPSQTGLENPPCVPPDSSSDEHEPPKPPKKAQARGRSIGFFALNEEDEKILKRSLEEGLPKKGQPKKKVKKKPAASTKAAPKKKAKAKASCSKGEKNKKEEEDQEGEPKENEDQEVQPQKKSTFKHRMSSSAYHKERKLAALQGLSPNSCKLAARAKAAKVSAQIDAGILKEDS